MSRFFLSLGALFGFLSVALGAFAAHGLKSHLDEYSLKVFHTGVDYQFYHTFALLLLGTLLWHTDDPWLHRSGYAFLFGIVIFSGSLYLLALTGVKSWGAITPIGGLGLLLGWAFLLKSVLSLSAKS